MSDWIDLQATLAVVLWFAFAFPTLVLQLALTFKLTTGVDEMTEIFERDNIAVALAVGGQLLGLVIIVLFGILHNETIPHMLVSSWLGWLLQMAAYWLLDRLTPRWDITAKLKEGQIASGVFVGVLFVALGLLCGGVIA
jgi:putative membrane protein